MMFGTGMIYQDVNIKVTAVENSHFAFHEGPAAGKHKSYSYRFETPDRVIVFTGDTGPSDAVTELARGADLLVTETYQCRGSEASDDQRRSLGRHDPCGAGGHYATGYSRSYDPRRYWENGHARQRQNRGSVAPDPAGSSSDGTAPWAEEVKKHFSGQVLIAKDLMEF